jgi:NAD(P)H-dependent flavin oxidoreductase YrpB (nitropropane dioxygenase family)
MIKTPFTERLSCTAPIQLAGMGRMNPPELVAAVSNAGGLGMFGSGSVPAHLVTRQCEAARALTAAKFGVNLLMPFITIPAVEAAAEGADVVEFFYGDPDPALVSRLHQAGKLAFWQVGSADEARAAEQAGCDFVIAQGIEGGGHIRGTAELLPLLSAVLTAVHVPVIAAGGIGTAREVAAVIAAGACAARVGTRFLAASESNAHPAYVQALIDAQPADTEVTEAFGLNWPDAPHRVLKSAIAAAQTCDDDAVARMDFGKGTLQPVPRWSVTPPDKSAVGDIRAMALYAGVSVASVKKIQPAAEIVRELAEGAARLLANQA